MCYFKVITFEPQMLGSQLRAPNMWIFA